MTSMHMCVTINDRNIADKCLPAALLTVSNHAVWLCDVATMGSGSAVSALSFMSRYDCLPPYVAGHLVIRVGSSAHVVCVCMSSRWNNASGTVCNWVPVNETRLACNSRGMLTALALGRVMYMWYMHLYDVQV